MSTTTASQAPAKPAESAKRLADRTFEGRGEVQHIVRNIEMRAAAELGVECRSLCGVWVPPHDDNNAPSVDQVLREPDVCKRCTKSLLARQVKELR